MTTLNIHQTIKEKLSYFHKIHKIPNIIFHGPSGGGKRTIVNEFIHKIYNNDKDKIKNFTMYVNCAHGKGIKFIRDELKFFAKTHINCNGGDIFKSIILLNADKLTMDAQSALRRCIELFSHNTRFFIIIEDKYNLLKPILSRFCEIYVPEPLYNNKIINLYKYNIDQVYKMNEIKSNHLDKLKKTIEKTFGINEKKTIKPLTLSELLSFSLKLYEKGYSGIDIIELLETNKLIIDKMTNEKKCELIITYNKIRKEFRNEKLSILFILNFMFLSSDLSLENISFM